MKHGTEYELLTKQVYQVLLNCEWPGKNIYVKHDIKLKGASGQEHQIDVYWEYELAGIKHKVAIECKDYSKPIAIGKVRDFYGLLVDLKDVKGIMVAANGFQKGAKEFALYYGINLKELSVSNETPIIAEIQNKFHISLRRCLFKIDDDWAKEKGWDLDAFRQRLSWISMDGEEWLNARHLPLQTTGSDIVDAEGNIISSIEEIETVIGTEITGGRKHVFPFENAYVLTASGPVKIKEVMILDKEEDRSNTIRLIAEGCVKAILKDAFENTITNILCPS